MILIGRKQQVAADKREQEVAEKTREIERKRKEKEAEHRKRIADIQRQKKENMKQVCGALETATALWCAELLSRCCLE